MLYWKPLSYSILLLNMLSFRSHRLISHSITIRNRKASRSSFALSAFAIPRSSPNFAATWQSQYKKYLSFEHLIQLNNQLTNYNSKLSKVEKKALRNELKLTYFARFHNLIREEFQYEKMLVDERLRTWPESRLKAEGYALFDLAPSSRGSLFQEKVIRFSNRRGKKLPFHSFSSGDSVKISISIPSSSFVSSGNSRRLSDPPQEEGMEGVVLERTSRYIDICISASSAASIDFSRLYRLDNFVNRVSYDRMIDGLQLLLQPSAGGNDSKPLVAGVSGIIRDLLLYSYPNSMLRLACTKGGLRLALPDPLLHLSPQVLFSPYFFFF